MEADRARYQLLEQHTRIRDHLERCVRLSHRLVDGEGVHGKLEDELVKLRTEFTQHNAAEAEVVRAFLARSAKWGALLVDRMMEEHAAEHAAVWEWLSGPVESVAERIDDLAEELEAHMAAEERTFLSPSVLHEPAIARHTPES